MITLLETRMINHGHMLEDFGFYELIEVPAEDQSGGMIVMWNHEVVTVHNFICRNQEIYATIEVLPIYKTWLFSSIYASTNYQYRIMWDNLENISNSYKGPWVIGGDFNDTLGSNENFGGDLLITIGQIFSYQRFLSVT